MFSMLSNHDVLTNCKISIILVISYFQNSVSDSYFCIFVISLVARNRLTCANSGNEGLSVIPGISKNKHRTERNSLKVSVNPRQPQESPCPEIVKLQQSSPPRRQSQLLVLPCLSIWRVLLLPPINWLQCPLLGTSFLNLHLLLTSSFSLLLALTFHMAYLVPPASLPLSVHIVASILFPSLVSRQPKLMIGFVCI